jgi:hypothetical protein
MHVRTGFTGIDRTGPKNGQPDRTGEGFRAEGGTGYGTGSDTPASFITVATTDFLRHQDLEEQGTENLVGTDALQIYPTCMHTYIPYIHT